jgi:hypothetical protein
MALLKVSLIGIVVLAGITIYKLIIFPLFLSRLSRIPAAHPLCHITSLWIYYIRWADIENRTLYRLHTEKGPILRLGPNELSVNCYEEGIKTIYGGGFEKTEFYPRRFTNYDGFVDSLYNKTHSYLSPNLIFDLLTSHSIVSSTLSLLLIASPIPIANVWFQTYTPSLLFNHRQQYLQLAKSYFSIASFHLSKITQSRKLRLKFSVSIMPIQWTLLQCTSLGLVSAQTLSRT